MNIDHTSSLTNVYPILKFMFCSWARAMAAIILQIIFEVTLKVVNINL